MPAPQRVQTWIAQNYQKPAIDQEWLADCSDWIASEFNLDPSRDFDQFIQHVEAQLLQSNLADSTVHGSGIDPSLVASVPPRNARRPAPQAPRQKKTTGSTPLLVEIKSITEIAHSAFSLLNTHQTRIDRADLGLAHDENAEQHPDEDEGPVPRFPRGMLRFELSDGLTTFRAVEFRSLPQLELGTTPLGYKMLLKSTPIRNGVAFLEPVNVVPKGYRTEDHDIQSEQIFLSSLRKRLGRPDPPPEAPIAAQPQANPAAQRPLEQPARQHQAPPIAQPQSPPTDIDDMYVDDEVDPDVLREMLNQMDEAIDVQENQQSIRALPTTLGSKGKGPDTKPTSHLDTASSSSGPSAPSSNKTSSYFTARSSGSKLMPDIGLSPRSAPLHNPDPDFDITWDLDDTESSVFPAKKHCATSTRPQASAQTKQIVPFGKRPLSPDPYDDLSFDMDVDEVFFEQVGMIERDALGIGTSSKDRGKGKDIAEEGTTSRGRPRAVGKKVLPGLASGTKPLAIYPVSPSGAERSTRAQSSTKTATSGSSLSGSTKTPMPQSTQSSDCRLTRDPSLIVISSSENEAPGGLSIARTLDLAPRRAHKRRAIDQDDVVDSDVIDISD